MRTPKDTASITSGQENPKRETSSPPSAGPASPASVVVDCSVPKALVSCSEGTITGTRDCHAGAATAVPHASRATNGISSATGENASATHRSAWMVVVTTSTGLVRKRSTTKPAWALKRTSGRAFAIKIAATPT